MSPRGEREWLEAIDGDRGGTADGIGEGTRGDEERMRGGAWVSLNIDLMVVATAENASERTDILTRLQCGFEDIRRRRKGVGGGAEGQHGSLNKIGITYSSLQSLCI